MRRAAAALVLLAACGAEAAPRTAPLDVRHVVLLVLDACHGDQLSFQRGPPGLTPNLDHVAAAGMRYDRASANATWTLPATASLLTGHLPERHGVVDQHRKAPDALSLLPEIFAQAGWRTAGFVQMVYASDAYGLAQGFADYRYYGPGEKHDDRLVDDVLAWRLAHSDDRTFLYVHARRPHGPYDADAEALARSGADLSGVPRERLELLSSADALVPGTGSLRPGELELVGQLYRANLAAIDERLAPLLVAALADPRTLLVVTADHGEALGQHAVFGHGSHAWAETLDIPLVFAGAGVAQGASGRDVFSVDVAPTLLELCGLGVPEDAHLDGQSLAPDLLGRPDPTERAPVVVAARLGAPGSRPVLAVLDGRDKLLLQPDGSVLLFDRGADRREEHDLAAERPEVVQRLRRLAESWVPPAADAPAAELDEQREADLRALGYAR